MLPLSLNGDRKKSRWFSDFDTVSENRDGIHKPRRMRAIRKTTRLIFDLDVFPIFEDRLPYQNGRIASDGVDRPLNLLRRLFEGFVIDLAGDISLFEAGNVLVYIDDRDLLGEVSVIYPDSQHGYRQLQEEEPCYHFFADSHVVGSLLALSPILLRTGFL